FRYLRPGMVDTETFLAKPPAGDCFVYYRGSNCYELDLVAEEDRRTFEVNTTCRAIEERFKLDPIVAAQRPAVPYRAEIYARHPLPVGFYHLGELTNAAGAELRDDRGSPPSSRSPRRAGVIIGLVALAAMFARRHGSPPLRKQAAWIAFTLLTMGAFVFDV